jgi:hypothetical protein
MAFPNPFCRLAQILSDRRLKRAHRAERTARSLEKRRGPKYGAAFPVA